MARFDTRLTRDSHALFVHEARPMNHSTPLEPGRWSVVIPYYNEADFLPDTLRSLKAQTVRGFHLILVDNASTDGSADLARAELADVTDFDVSFLAQPTPGQVHALEMGLAAVTTEFVAVCDADTRYPPDYLAKATALYAASGPGVVAALAFGAPEDAQGPAARRRRWLYARVITKLLRYQCHAGGHGHTFRTAALRQAGGYSAALWPFVLKDHELMNRVFRVGAAIYHEDFWCQSSPRREVRTNVRWTLFERIVYHATPFALKDWFFYSFLKNRFIARKLRDTTLRDQSWKRVSGD
jgi:glycosyltransferase involved in cell wall biosynthesis